MSRRTVAVWLASIVLMVAPMLPAGGSASASGGAPSLRWTRTMGSTLADVVTTPDGQEVVVGSTIGRHPSNYRALVRRYTTGGAVVWQRYWSTPNGYSSASSVTLGPDGSVYVVGAVGSTQREGGGFLLLKYSPEGALLWQRLPAGWQMKSEHATGVAVIGDVLAISGEDSGCCG